MVYVYEVRCVRSRETVWTETEARAFEIARLLEASESVRIVRIEATGKEPRLEIYRSADT